MGLPLKSVNRPVTVTMFFIGIIIFGLISLKQLPVELTPNRDYGQISIIISVRGGMPPTEVESLITRQVEEAVGTVSHLKSISSSSRESLSVIGLNFDPETNMDFASLEVREKFSRIKNKLPREANKPVIAKWEYSQNATLILTATSDGYTPEQLRTKIDENFKGALTRVDGVANVEVWGGRERKILVDLDQKKLTAFNISYEKVMNMLSENNFNLLVGEIEGVQNKLLIRTLGLFNTIEDIRKIGIGMTPQGSIIRLQDVADVSDSFLEASAFSRVNLYDAVAVYISKESNANTLQVTTRIQKEISRILNKLNDKNIKLTILYNQGEDVDLAIKAVEDSLWQGALLSIIVLLVFLWDVSATIVIGLSIPISVIATFIFMNLFGITLNVMTLSGLALGTGMLVDNSIVVLENIFKKRHEGQSLREASIDGSEEVWVAIMASTITTVAVFLPMMFVDKEIRMLYSGLAITVTFSIISSLFVAVSLVPMSYSQFSKVSKLKVKKHRVQEFFKKIYQELLIISLRYRYILIIFIFITFSIAIFQLTRIGMEISGGMSKDQFSINITPPPGTKIEHVDSIIKKIEKLLSDMPEVETISSSVKKDDPKIIVTLLPEVKRKKTKKEIVDILRSQTSKIPKYFIYYYTGAQESDTKEIIIDIYGHDYEKLRKIANAIGKTISVLPYLSDIKLRMRDPRPEYNLVVDKQRALYYGLSIKRIADSVHGQMRGFRATKFHSESEEIETITRIKEDERKTLSDLENLVITSRTGRGVYLKQIAGFIPSKGPTEIYRNEKHRMIEVSANIGDKDLGTVASEAEELLKSVKFPKNYFYRFGGDYPLLKKSKNQLTGAVAVTIILVYMILASLFQSYSQPLIIMISVPLAAIGVLVGLKLADKTLSTSVFIGMIMLAGIVVNNAIILVDHANFLKSQGRRRLRVAIEAGKDRLRPICMTTFTTILGLIPMALDKGKASDLWSPLAITVMGGLISSTFLTLIVIPNIYILFDDAALSLKTFFSKNKSLIELEEIPNEKYT